MKFGSPTRNDTPMTAILVEIETGRRIPIWRTFVFQWSFKVIENGRIRQIAYSYSSSTALVTMVILFRFQHKTEIGLLVKNRKFFIPPFT